MKLFRSRRALTASILALFLSIGGAACTSGAGEAVSEQTSSDQAAEVEQSSSDQTEGADPGTGDAIDGASAGVGDDAIGTDDADGEPSADGIPDPADLDEIEQLWVDNGTDPELARCYRGVLADAGVDEVADLNQLTQIMADLDNASKQAIDDCL